jgi:RNA ligase
VSRPLHKFFNVGERAETQPDLVDLSAPHVILEKLDGSMIRPIPLGDGYRLGTKMGVTDVSRQAEAFVARRLEYDRLIRAEIAAGRTPVFEWCSRAQRIVVDHPEDRLVLLAVRENRSGRYLGLDELASLLDVSDFRGVELVGTYPGTAASVHGLISDARGASGAEGWVIRFADGHMLKVKSEWYVMRHKALSGLSSEKDVIALLAAAGADDVKPLLAPEPRAKLEAFEKAFHQGFGDEVAHLRQLYAGIRARVGDDRKGFALGEAKELPSAVRALMFQAWEGRDLAEELMKLIARNTSSSTKIEEVRWAWGGRRWSFDFDGDA